MLAPVRDAHLFSVSVAIIIALSKKDSDANLYKILCAVCKVLIVDNTHKHSLNSLIYSFCMYDAILLSS